MTTNFLFFIFSIGIIVVVHELGHLIVAKRNGVYCHTFSIGMGPAIKHLYTDKSGTTYYLRAIPLGGYVMLAGEQYESENDVHVPYEKKIDSKGKWVRFKIFFAGSFMNILLCVLLLSITSFFGGVSNMNSTQIYVAPGSNMEAAGIETGDIITEVNGVPVNDYAEITDIASTSDTVVFTTAEDENVEVSKNEEGYYGFSQYLYKYELIPSIINGFISTIGLFISVLLSIILLFTPAAGIENLAGPVGIYSMGEEIVSSGWIVALSWIAYLSVNIGFINLLPIPVCDGGRIMFIIYEAIFKRKPSKKIENNLIVGSAIVLLMLFVYITFNDIARIIGG